MPIKTSHICSWNLLPAYRRDKYLTHPQASQLKCCSRQWYKMHGWNERQPSWFHLSGSEAADTSWVSWGQQPFPPWWMWLSTSCKKKNKTNTSCCCLKAHLSSLSQLAIRKHNGPFGLTATTTKLETASAIKKKKKMSTKNVAFGGISAPLLIGKHEYWLLGVLIKKSIYTNIFLNGSTRSFVTSTFYSTVIGYYFQVCNVCVNAHC